MQGAGQQGGDRLLCDQRVTVHGGPSGCGVDIGLAHDDQRGLVPADDVLLLFKQLEVFRALEAADQLLFEGLEGIDTVLNFLRGGLITIGEHVLQARYPKVGERGVEACDVAHPVTAVDQFVQTEPVADCHQAGEAQYQTEAQGQF